MDNRTAKPSNIPQPIVPGQFSEKPSKEPPKPGKTKESK